MSLEGVGVVTAVPIAVGAAAAIATVAVAGAVAGAGYLVAKEGSKAIIACGRELHKMAAENLKMQEVIRESARQYDRELQRSALLQNQRRADTIRSHLAQYRSLQEQRIRELEKMRNQPITPVKIDWSAVDNARARIVAESRPKEWEVLLISGWPQRITDLQVYIETLGERLAAFTAGNNAQLFKTDGLAWLLEEAKTRLQPLESSSTDVVLEKIAPPVNEYEQVWAAALYLERKIKEMELLAPERMKQRAASVEALWQARVKLQELLVEYDSTEVEGISHVRRMLDNAEAALTESEFARAVAGAKAVMQHLAHLAEVGQMLRRRNLTLLIQTWEERIEPLKEFQPLSSEVARWFEERDKVAALLQQDVTTAWQSADGPDGLLERAEQIFEKAGRLLSQSTTDLLGNAAQECLSEMGYQVEMSVEDGGTRSLLGRNKQGHKVTLAISDQGTLAFKVTGHGDEGCKAVFAEFIQKLRDRGVGIAYQTEFSLGEATDTLVKVLQSAGFDNVWVEPSDDGVSIMAIGKPEFNATVGYDGPDTLSPDLQHLWQEHVDGITYSSTDPDVQEDLWKLAQQEYQDMQKYRIRERA